MTGGTRPAPLADGAGPRRTNRWLAGGALAVGLAIGGVLGAGIAAATDDDAAGTVAAPPVASDPAGQDPSPDSGAEARVSDACLRAVAAAEQTYDAIEDLAGALLAFDARRLDEVVHELRPLQDQLERGTAACRVDVRRPGDPAGPSEPPSAPPTSPPAAPTPSPPASPTG
ncbi:hypothetical protein [Geodermatophilus sp. SYSU D01176]